MRKLTEEEIATLMKRKSWGRKMYCKKCAAYKYESTAHGRKHRQYLEIPHILPKRKSRKMKEMS